MEFMKVQHVKYLILGAGPSGLSFANRLLEKGITNFLVLEKERYPGGLCRSVDVDGSPFDIGGGHFLDVKKKNVLKFLFSFMPEKEWKLFKRNSKIQLKNSIINNPIEANIWQMDLPLQVEYLKAIAIAGCNLGVSKPKLFTEWIYWKLGGKIAEDYMIPYNKKMFGEMIDILGTYWLDKLPDVSFEETLLSCLTKKAYGKQPAHAEFLYPLNYGYGEIWNRMAEKIKEKIRYSCDVKTLNLNTKIINGQWQADCIIVTIPWCEFDTIIGMPEHLMNNIAFLKYSSIVTTYYPDSLNTKAHWIYYPQLDVEYHRILLRFNFNKGSKGYWTETNLNRFNNQKKMGNTYYVNKYSYPLNTIEKPDKINELLNWAKCKKVYGLGRWGEWQHYNSDVVVERALGLADSF